MTRDLESEFPALWQLMGAYLHQDHDLTGTIDENVMLFLSDEPQLASAIPDEIALLLIEQRTETELAGFVDALGAEVLPPDGLTYRAWLTQIADHVRVATGGTTRSD